MIVVVVVVVVVVVDFQSDTSASAAKSESHSNRLTDKLPLCRVCTLASSDTRQEQVLTEHDESVDGNCKPPTLFDAVLHSPLPTGATVALNRWQKKVRET